MFYNISNIDENRSKTINSDIKLFHSNVFTRKLMIILMKMTIYKNIVLVTKLPAVFTADLRSFSAAHILTLILTLNATMVTVASKAASLWGVAS